AQCVSNRNKDFVAVDYIVDLHRTLFLDFRDEFLNVCVDAFLHFLERLEIEIPIPKAIRHFVSPSSRCVFSSHRPALTSWETLTDKSSCVGGIARTRSKRAFSMRTTEVGGRDEFVIGVPWSYLFECYGHLRSLRS